MLGLPVLIVARPLTEASVGQSLPLRQVAEGRAPAGTVPVWISEALVDQRGLRLGDEAVCVVKATHVIVEVPSGREGRP